MHASCVARGCVEQGHVKLPSVTEHAQKECCSVGVFSNVIRQAPPPHTHTHQSQVSPKWEIHYAGKHGNVFFLDAEEAELWRRVVR